MQFVECCGYPTELCTHFAFQFFREESFAKKIKESPWHSMKMAFGRTVSQIRHNNQSIRVVFEAPHLEEPGLMAGVRWQVAGVR